eukprot:scaffold17854_cov124-Isochrysis_galbana.AAC.7
MPTRLKRPSAPEPLLAAAPPESDRASPTGAPAAGCAAVAAAALHRWNSARNPSFSSSSRSCTADAAEAARSCMAEAAVVAAAAAAASHPCMDGGCRPQRRGGGR